jgi:hypothetical protein
VDTTLPDIGSRAGHLLEQLFAGNADEFFAANHSQNNAIRGLLQVRKYALQKIRHVF